MSTQSIKLLFVFSKRSNGMMRIGPGTVTMDMTTAIIKWNRNPVDKMSKRSAVAARKQKARPLPRHRFSGATPRPAPRSRASKASLIRLNIVEEKIMNAPNLFLWCKFASYRRDISIKLSQIIDFSQVASISRSRITTSMISDLMPSAPWCTSRRKIKNLTPESQNSYQNHVLLKLINFTTKLKILPKSKFVFSAGNSKISF